MITSEYRAWMERLGEAIADLDEAVAAVRIAQDTIHEYIKENPARPEPPALSEADRAAVRAELRGEGPQRPQDGHTAVSAPLEGP